MKFDNYKHFKNYCLKVAKSKEYIVSDTLKKVRIKGIQEIEEVCVANNYIFIKSKFYQGPTLEKYIEEQKGYENENKIKLVLEHFLQIVRALKNLHDSGFVHLDLKSDNCIFTRLENSSCILFDFGEDNFGELPGCWNGVFIPKPLSDIFLCESNI